MILDIPKKWEKYNEDDCEIVVRFLETQVLKLRVLKKSDGKYELVIRKFYNGYYDGHMVNYFNLDTSSLKLAKKQARKIFRDLIRKDLE